ncbi:MAG: hypothetical protein K8S56_10585 [Candidatus Cloacimonetes bacterium]|nr:hypothetical protein [Candidatus Cloacimonadota bacterium]
MTPKEKILHMVASGRINSEEAARLLQALGGKKQARTLTFQIWTALRETPLVEVIVPLTIVRLGMRFVPDMIKLKAADHQFNLSAVNWNDVFEIAARGDPNEILDVSIDDGDADIRLRIFLS